MNNEALILAAKNRNVEEVVALLNEGADPNYQDGAGRTALFYVANHLPTFRENITIAEHLVMHGARIDDSMLWNGDNVMNTVFMETIHTANNEMLKKLIHAGMNKDFHCKIHVLEYGRSNYEENEPLYEAVNVIGKCVDKEPDKRQCRSLAFRRNSERYEFAKESDFLFHESRVPAEVTFPVMKEIVTVLLDNGFRSKALTPNLMSYYCSNKEHSADLVALFQEKGIEGYTTL